MSLSANKDSLMPQLSWDVNQFPVYANNNVASKYKAIIHDQSNEVLHISKKGYTPLTNEKFMDFTSNLVKLTGFKLIGYENYCGGRKVMAYMENPLQKSIAGWPGDKYMVFGNSHDGSTGLFGSAVSRIHRCQNMFAHPCAVSLRHTKKIHQDIDDLLRFIVSYEEQNKVLDEKFEQWMGINMSPELMNMIVDETLDIEDREEISTRKSNQLGSVLHSIEVEMNAMGENAFGLLNGFTHYSTHKMKGETKSQMAAVGASANFNMKAFRSIEHVLETV